MSKNYNGERIKKRDNYSCVYCGSRQNLTVDHVIPISKYAHYRLRYREVHCDGNLVTSCQTCNTKKTNTSPEEFFRDNPDKRKLFLSRAIFVNDKIKGLVRKL